MPIAHLLDYCKTNIVISSVLKWVSLHEYYSHRIVLTSRTTQTWELGRPFWQSHMQPKKMETKTRKLMKISSSLKGAWKLGWRGNKCFWFELKKVFFSYEV
jgi:hypothetical protein